MAAELLDDSRPDVAVDGKADDELRQALLSLLITESTAGLCTCEASFGNLGTSGGKTDFLYFDRQKFDFGKSLRISIKGKALFDGRITALEGRFPGKSPPELGVLSEDRLQDLRMTRRTRSFADQSDADVFNHIADEHGLDKDIQLQGGKYKALAQVNQSDLAFLRERARAVAAELWIEPRSDGKAVLKARARPDRESGTPIKLGWRNELQEYEVIADLAGQRTAVVASGWDPGAKDKVSYEASELDVRAELGSDESGAGILQSKLGARKEAIVHTGPFDASEAQARAQAFFRMSARRFVVGRGVARTDGRVRVGTWVELDGLGPLFNGRYYVAETRHRFDGSKGMRTEFTAERPGLGQAR
jgi:phage protein D